MAICEDCGNFRTWGWCSCKYNTWSWVGTHSDSIVIDDQPQRQIAESQKNATKKNKQRYFVLSYSLEALRYIFTFAIFIWIFCFLLKCCKLVLIFWLLAIACFSAYNISTKKFDAGVGKSILLSAWQAVEISNFALTTIHAVADIATAVPYTMKTTLNEIDGIMLFFNPPEDVRERIYIWENSWIASYFLSEEDVIAPPNTVSYIQDIQTLTEWMTAKYLSDDI